MTGMRFGPVSDARLAPGAEEAVPQPGDGAAESPKRSRVSGRAGLEGASKREQAFCLLAAAAALRTHTRETIAKVVMLTLSPDHEVRRATVPVLMQISGQDGVISLIRLLEDVNPAVQGEAAEALGRLQAKPAVGPLRTLLHHNDDEVALRAAEALGRMQDSSGLRRVVRILRQDTPMSRRAAHTLGIIVGREFRPNTSGVAAARRHVKTHML